MASISILPPLEWRSRALVVSSLLPWRALLIPSFCNKTGRGLLCKGLFRAGILLRIGKYIRKILGISFDHRLLQVILQQAVHHCGHHNRLVQISDLQSHCIEMIDKSMDRLTLLLLNGVEVVGSLLLQSTTDKVANEGPT